MPILTDLTNEQITDLVQASIVLLSEGPKSPAYKQLLEKWKNDEAFLDLVRSKESRVSPGWWQRLLRMGAGFLSSNSVVQGALRGLTGFAALPGVRHVLGAFGSGGQVPWRLAVAGLVVAVAAPLAARLLPAGTPPELPPYQGRFRTQGYYDSRYSSLHILRAATAPTIDGDPTDWPTERRFRNAFVAPWNDHYSVEGAMMLDDQALYILAIVGDPYPMRNAREHPDEWNGGSVQIHLAMRNVAIDETFDKKKQETDRDLVKLALWYSAAKGDVPGVGKVSIARTIPWNFDPKKDDARVLRHDQDGVQAIFKEGAGSRKGYTLEYKIPWSLLRADKNAASPWAGLSSPLSRVCWEIHWSDESGTTFRGKVSEVVNMNNETNAYEDANAWGKALIHAP